MTWFDISCKPTKKTNISTSVLSRPVLGLVGWLVGRSVRHNFLTRREVSLSCFYRSTYFCFRPSFNMFEPTFRGAQCRFSSSIPLCGTSFTLRLFQSQNQSLYVSNIMFRNTRMVELNDRTQCHFFLPFRTSSNFHKKNIYQLI